MLFQDKRMVPNIMHEQSLFKLDGIAVQAETKGRKKQVTPVY